MKTIKMYVKGGVVQDIIDIPQGVDVHVLDFDVTDISHDRAEQNMDGDWFMEDVYTSKEPEETKPEKKKVWVMDIDTSYGHHIQAFDSEEKMQKAVLEFVEENWHKVMGDDVKLDTLSRSEAIEKYFEASSRFAGDDDVLNWDEVEVQ